MARFLKQSFAQTCLKETDNGKLQQFNYSRLLTTNRGNGREKKNSQCVCMKENTQTLICVKNLRDRIIGRIAKNYYAPLGRET